MRCGQGLERWQTHVGKPPDVITLSSAFWDIAGWVSFAEAALLILVS